MSGAILYPQGLHGAQSILGELSRLVGSELKPYSTVGLYRSTHGYSDQFKAAMAQSPGLVILPTSVKINDELFQLHGNGQVVFGSASTGVDHVDFSMLERTGARFIHAPGANADSVVEYVISLIVKLFSPSQLEHPEFRVGIIGYGRIGSRLGALLEMLEIDHCYYDPFLPAAQRHQTLARTLDSNLVTFHTPLTRSGPHPTIAMVDRSYAEMIRSDAVIFNTGRGEIIDRETYRWLVETHRCVIDVFPVEPPEAWMVERPTYASPHVAGYNYAARAGATRMVAAQYLKLCGVDHILSGVQPVLSQFNVFDFIESESSALKENPDSFAIRRNHYPDRGSLYDAVNLGKDPGSNRFTRRLFELYRKPGQ